MSAPTRYIPVPITTSSAAASPPQPPGVDSDFVVIMAALLCALLCVVGLVTVVRCAWIRRYTGGGAGGAGSHPQLLANKGLKKKILRSLPTAKYNPEENGELQDCAICLTEFGDGDDVRILPQCGHGFHVSCIDTWLGSHSSCPSCRRVLVVAVCKKCGGVPESATAEIEPREDDVYRFLP